MIEFNIILCLFLWYDAGINALVLHKHVPDHKANHIANFTPIFTHFHNAPQTLT
jgi:hypothetical protein